MMNVIRWKNPCRLCLAAVGALSFACFPSWAATTYPWPGAGETLVLGDQEEATIQNADDVAAASALGAIQLGAGSKLIYSCADAPLNLTAPLSGAGTFKAASGNHLNLLEDASAFTGGFNIVSTPTCVSNRFGLGTAASKTAVVERGTCPDTYFFTFGGAGLTNDVPLSILARNENDPTNVTQPNFSWDSRLAGDTGLLVLNGLVTFRTTTFLYTEDCVYGGGIVSEGGVLEYHTLTRTANTVTICDTLRTANGGTLAFQSYSGGASASTDPTFVLSCTNFNTKYLDLRRATIRCMATNVFSSPVSGFYVTTMLNKYGGAYQDGNIDLNGYDQAIPRLKVGYTVAEGDTAKYYNTMSSAKPAVMTILSSEDDTVPYLFTGSLSLRFAGTGAFRLAHIRSTSTGTLQVDSGTLQLKWGAGWGGTNVVVTGGTLQLDSSFALKDYKAEVFVSGGRFALGKDGVAEVKSLTVNGTPLPTNCYYAQADLDALGYGDLFDIADGAVIAVDIHEIEVTDHVWSGASTTSAYLDDPDNWAGDVPNLSDGSARLIFGSGLKSPVVRAHALVHSLVFASDTGVALSSENGAKLTVRGGNVEMTRATVGEGVSTNVVTAPLVFAVTDHPVVSVGENVHLRLVGPLSGGTAVQDLLLCGPGSLELAGDNSELVRQLIVSNFTSAAFLHPYALGAPVRETILWKHPATECFQRYVFAEAGLTNRVPFAFHTAMLGGDYSQTGEPSWTHAGEKFVTYGMMDTLGASTTIILGDTEFHGGIKSTTGSIMMQGEGTVVFLDEPINDSSGWLNLYGASTPDKCVFRFGTTGNVWCPWNFNAYRCTIVCDADNALCETSDLQLGAGNSSNGEKVRRRPTTLDLNGHDQRIKTLCHYYYGGTGAFPWDVAKGDPEYVTVTSAVPATLTLTSGAFGDLTSTKDVHGTVATNSVRFRGAAGLRFAGPYGFTFLNHFSDTTGTLEVDSGRVSIEYNAGWGGPVLVKGGTLAIAADAAATAFTYEGRLSPQAVTMAGGVLELPAGETVTVKDLIVETGDASRTMARGYYGSPTCVDPRVPAENRLDCLTGEGVLYAKSTSGLLLIVR